jgi:hypothetical protein
MSQRNRIILAFCVAGPILLLSDLLGDLGRGRAAAIAAFMLIGAAQWTWDQRRNVWYWVVLAALIAAHVYLVFILPWSGQRFLWISLMPLAVLDGLVSYGVIRLVQRLMSVFGNKI